MGGYFTKHHPPYHHRENCATYLYIANVLHKTYYKIVHKWDNAMITPLHTVAITPIHTVAITSNRNVLQERANFVCTYGHKNTKTIT